MRKLGSNLLLLRFPSETQARRITFRVADGLPYGLIVGADYLRNEESILDFRPGKSLKYSQNASWIRFLDHTPPALFIASLTDSRASNALDATHRTSRSHENMAWEDDSTLEWDVYLRNHDISADGYVSKAVRGYAIGPMAQDKQLLLALILTKRRTAREKRQWWGSLEGQYGGNQAPRLRANWSVGVTNR